jgi:metal-responsive CopG/Arc/MetJ family transcriptional regulator
MKRLTTSLTDEQYAEVQDMRQKERRTTSAMLSILLAQAIKERNRKKKPNKELLAQS